MGACATALGCLCAGGRQSNSTSVQAALGRVHPPEASVGCRFELSLRIARMYGNLDDEVQANLDRTFKRIDDHGRNAGEERLSKRYGSVFRNEMKELQAKYRIGEKESLAQWIEK